MDRCRGCGGTVTGRTTTVNRDHGQQDSAISERPSDGTNVINGGVIYSDGGVIMIDVLTLGIQRLTRHRHMYAHGQTAPAQHEPVSTDGVTLETVRIL